MPGRACPIISAFLTPSPFDAISLDVIPPFEIKKSGVTSTRLMMSTNAWDILLANLKFSWKDSARIFFRDVYNTVVLPAARPSFILFEIPVNATGLSKNVFSISNSIKFNSDSSSKCFNCAVVLST